MANATGTYEKMLVGKVYATCTYKVVLVEGAHGNHLAPHSPVGIL